MNIELLREELCYPLAEHILRHFQESIEGDLIFTPYDKKGLPSRQTTLDNRLVGLNTDITSQRWERYWVLWDEASRKIWGHADLTGSHLVSARHRCKLGIGLESQIRGLGWGKKLMSIVIDWAKSNHFEYIDLGVFEENTTALRLYESFGFKKTGLILDAFRVADKKITDIQMTLKL